MDRPDIAANITEVRRQEMERARDILGVRQDWLGFVDSGWPEGDPQAAAARGLLRAGAARGVHRAAGPADARLQAARRHDVRREGRLPAPRPHPLPRGERRGVRGGRRPRALPRRRRAVAAAEALLPPRLELREDQGDPRRDARARPGVAVRRAAGEVGARRGVGRSGSPRGCRAATTSGSATRRCSRTRPRSTPTARGSRSRASIQAQVWPTEDFELVTSHVETSLPEDDLFAGIRGR